MIYLVGGASRSRREDPLSTDFSTAEEPANLACQKISHADGSHFALFFDRECESVLVFRKTSRLQPTELCDRLGMHRQYRFQLLLTNLQ
jgi:hypothetical protein